MRRSLPLRPCCAPPVGAGSAVGSTHWKQPCGVAIEPFGRIRAPATPRLSALAPPGALCGVPPCGAPAVLSPFGRSGRSQAPSIRSLVRSSVGRPSGAPRLSASVRAFTESARPLSPSGVSSVASLPRSRCFAPRPPFRRGRARFLRDPRSDQKQLAFGSWFPPTPAFPLGKGRHVPRILSRSRKPLRNPCSHT